jgi:hypothetical protein
MPEESTSTAEKHEADTMPRFVSTTQTTVPTLDYTQLRLMAECAEGTEGETQFVFNNGTLSVNASATALDTEILVTAESVRRRPANRVYLQVAAGATMDRGSATLEVGSADAVFWSDAAVQKFLFPYIASCGGHQAGENLTLLQSAWNFYPSTQVTVYALVHRIAQPGELLGIGSIIRVVYSVAGGSQLQLAELGQFVQQYPPTTPVQIPPPVQTPYWRGVEGTPPQYQYPSEQLLRMLAEHAESLRGEAQYFLCPPDAPARYTGPITASDFLATPDLADGTLVIPVSNPALPADRPQLGGVWFWPSAPATANVNLSVVPGVAGWARSADALFWSTGAVEQFLFPYYASVDGFAGIADLGRMAMSWSLDVPVDPPVPIVLGSPGPGEALQVLGLIHMPTSEWTEIQDWTAEGNGQSLARKNVGVLYADAQGQVHVTRAGEFSAMNPRRRRG